MKKVKLLAILLLVALLTLSFVGCDGDEETPEDQLTYAEGTVLRMAVAHNNNKTSITFKDSTVVGSGLTLADGKTYQVDDLKPVWAELEKILKVNFTDVYRTGKSAQNEFKAWQALNYEGVDVLVGNADDMTEEGKLGKIVNLADYLDQMPNFKAFLEANPIVKLSVISDTKTEAIYYAPYFDGFDDIERYYLMRSDWIEKLLDGSGDFTAAQSDKFVDISGAVAYEPYMPLSGKLNIVSLKADGSGTQTITKDFDTDYGNIAKYMNDHINANTTGVDMVNWLRDYIDEAYDGYYGNNRSKLFTGYDACWDADELVALLRCIVTNTFALTGQNTTKVTGIFPREYTTNRVKDLYSLVSLWGIRGTESRNDYLYFDANGNLVDARGDVKFIEGLNKISTLYKEKLILQDFNTRTDTIYKTMYQQNLGFMLFDYCQTQTLYNDNEDVLKKCPDFNLTPVINNVAKWYDGSNIVDDVDQGTWMRFTESWRSVKTNGWCIPATCTGDALKAALKMFDYMYSEEGNILMSFGPEAWRTGDTILYKGEQIPEMKPEVLETELWGIAGGNYTNYARIYLGSTLPIGFVKNQGMEYQCTTEGGKIGSEIVSRAIAQGVLKHVSPYISDNLFYTMVPTTLPTTAQQDLLISGYAAISSGGIFSSESDGINIFTEFIKHGFGTDVTISGYTYIDKTPASAQAFVTDYLNRLGGQAYIVVRQSAWDKLKTYYDDHIKE